jgi:hypothetical protein
MPAQYFSQSRFDIHGPISALGFNRDLLSTPNAPRNMDTAGRQIEILDVEPEYFATAKICSLLRCEDSTPLPLDGIDNFPHLIFGKVALLPFRDFWKREIPILPAFLSEDEFRDPQNVADGLWIRA